MSKKFFIVWGSAGHSKVINDIIQQADGKIVALFDSNTAAKSSIPNTPIFYGANGLKTWINSCNMDNIIGAIAIGGSRGRSRQEIGEIIMGCGIHTPPLIHATASVSKAAIVGLGSHVLANSVVAAGVNIGKYCIINNSANVDHESVIRNGVHIAPGAVLCGCVDVGENTLIGAGATVLPRIRIGKNVIVGAGSVVIRDVPDGVVVAGNPAIFIKKRNGND